jgi:hypothetical protein
MDLNGHFHSFMDLLARKYLNDMPLLGLMSWFFLGISWLKWEKYGGCSASVAERKNWRYSMRSGRHVQVEFYRGSLI